MKISAILALTAGGALLLAGCKKHPAPTSESDHPVRVAVTVARAATASGEASYSGTVAAGEETPLSFTIGGTVTSVVGQVGTPVRKGALVATLDAASLRHAYDITRAEEEQARDAYNRLKMLHQAQALPEIKWVDIQAKLRQAEAATAIARKALADANLYAPYAGVISQKMVNEGQTVAPGLPVVMLQSRGGLQVEIAVPENAMASVTPAARATVTCAALEGEAATTPIEAHLAQKGVQADPLTRAYTVKYDLVEPPSGLLPGMVCTLHLVPQGAPAPDGAAASGAPGEILVPVEAVMLRDDNTRMVWVVDSGRARPRPVLAGAMRQGGVAITRGLAAGDTVIVAGQQQVGDGSRVTTVETRSNL